MSSRARANIKLVIKDKKRIFYFEDLNKSIYYMSKGYCNFFVEFKKKHIDISIENHDNFWDHKNIKFKIDGGDETKKVKFLEELLKSKIELVKLTNWDSYHYDEEIEEIEEEEEEEEE